MKKRDDLIKIINLVILETGLKRELVTKVVNSFLSCYQDKVSEGPVFIRGFGEMKGEMSSRSYWDINKAVQDSTTVAKKPKVRFTPSKEFLKLIGYHNAETER